MKSTWWPAMLLAMALALVGCRTELVTRQSEADANEIAGALLSAGIRAEKGSTDNGKTFDVLVEREDVVRALGILRASGLPRERRVSLGDMFKKEGLISTPTEERIRFIHGVSQELSDTLSRIDGVINAKVHIVLPNNDPLATTVRPSSASVFVKFRWDADLSALTPAIKNLVSRSVEGLAYDNVTVTLVPGVAAPPPAVPVADKGWSGLGIILVLAMATALLAVGLLAAASRWRPAWIPAAIARRLPAWFPRVRAPAAQQS